MGLSVRSGPFTLCLAWLAFLAGKSAESNAHVTSYAVDGRGVAGIVETNDGSIWYAARFSNAIGRLDPATATSTLLLPPTPNSAPAGLTSCARRLWFVEAGSTGLRQIGYVEQGKAREIPVAGDRARDGELSSQYVGPVCFQHNLWFASPRSNGLWRYDLESKAFAFFALRQPPGGIAGIASDSKGGIYVVELGAQRVDYVTALDSRARQIDIPRGLRLTSAITSGDGGVWVATSRGMAFVTKGRVSRLIPTPPVVAATVARSGELWLIARPNKLPGSPSLLRVKVRKGTYSTVPIPRSLTLSYAIAPDRSDGVWIAAWNHFGTPSARQRMIHVASDDSMQ